MSLYFVYKWHLKGCKDKTQKSENNELYRGLLNNFWFKNEWIGVFTMESYYLMETGTFKEWG